MVRRFSLVWWTVGIFGFYLAVGASCVCNYVVPPAKFPDPALGPGNLHKSTTALSGCLEVRPALQDFGTMPIRCGGTLHKDVEIVHKGLSTCPRSVRVDALRLLRPEQSGFQIEKRPALPHTLAPGESMRIKLSFQTKQPLSLADSLQILTDAPGQEKLKIDLVGKGVTDLSQRDVYKQVLQASDILFIVDNSRSMRQEHAFLAKNFSSFMQWAQRYHSDYQLGVVAIRTADRTFGCLEGSPNILTPKTPNLAKAFETIATSLDSYRGAEMGLEAAYLALSTRLSTCNKGFLRKNAVLSMIFISDEPDQSPEEYEFYLNFFKKLKGEDRSHLVRASVVVGPSPDGCRSTFGRAQPGPKYIQLAKDLQGVSASICEENWSKPLEQIGLWSILSRVNFPLTRQPVAGSIRVSLNDKPIPQDEKNGWQYDPSQNQILFRGGSTPVPGTVISIQYLVDCPQQP